VLIKTGDSERMGEGTLAGKEAGDGRGS